MFFLDLFTQIKDLFGALLRLEPDALHVHVGIAVFFGVALLVRGPRAFVTAFWVALAVSLVTEVFDLLYDYHSGRRVRWLNSVKDVGNAMIWPAAWLLFGDRIVRLVTSDRSGERAAPRAGVVAEEAKTTGDSGNAVPSAVPKVIPVPAPPPQRRAPNLEGMAE